MNADNLIPLLSIIFLFAICIIAFLIIRAIWRAIKRFTFEIIDHANGTSTGMNTRTSKRDYTREARKACEKVTPKRKQNTTPPWEE